MERPVAKEDKTPTTTTPKKRRLQLNSVGAGRKTVARLIRLYDNREISEVKYRGLLFGMKTLLGYFEIEKNLEFERDIVYIKKMLKR